MRAGRGKRRSSNGSDGVSTRHHDCYVPAKKLKAMRRFRSAACICALASFAACSHATHAAKPAQPPRATQPPRRIAPTATPVAPTATPSPERPQIVLRTVPPAIVKHPVRLPPNAAPKILAVAMSETTVHRGDHVSGSVITTSNVASVQARIGGYAMPLDKVGVGRFALTYTVNVPWFVRGNFDLHVIATNTAGATVERIIALTVR